MRAHNRGVELCDTELFVCIDSDDYLASPHAVAEVLAYWQDNADITQRDDICGIVSYKKMEKHNQTTFPDGLRTSTLTALYEQGFNGETTLVFKTNILRHYPFPVAEGEKFVTEAIVYDMLDQHYELLLFRHYTQICEYQADGYTANGMDVMLKNPKGYRNYYNQLVALGKGNKRYHAQMYIALSLFIGDGKTLAIASKKWFTMLCMPMGIYQYWKLKRRKW
jgi:glycosyltransferase involved in cell wall biosynthesis